MSRLVNEIKGTGNEVECCYEQNLFGIVREIVVHGRTMKRLAEIGGWPSWFDGEGSMMGRVPQGIFGRCPGLDAGLACLLGLIPVEKQALSAKLHASYTREAVEQVRREIVSLDADSEAAWWFAACSLCDEGQVDVHGLIEQIEKMEHYGQNPEARLEAAKRGLQAMQKSYGLIDGVPFAEKDGGLQSAYIAGFDWGVQSAASAYGLFFIGTLLPSLGLEDFPFSDRVDESGRPMSGPVHGSQQFVKVSTFAELARAVDAVMKKLGPPKK